MNSTPINPTEVRDAPAATSATERSGGGRSRRIANRFAVLLTGFTVWTAPVVLENRSAFGEWADRRTFGLFQLQSEIRLSADSDRQLSNLMSTLQNDVQRLLHLEVGGQAIEVNLFRNKWSYQAYIRKRIPEGVSRPALFVKGDDRGRVYVYRRWGFENDLRHECTHAVLHNSLAYVPLWIDEGLAEYFEVPSHQRTSGNPHLAELKRRAFFGWKPNLVRLEALGSLAEMDAADYRESWAWAHFLLNGPQPVRQVLSDYLYDIRVGNIAGALSDRLFAEFPDAEARLIAHIRGWK